MRNICSGGARNYTCSTSLPPYLLGNVRYCGRCQGEVTECNHFWTTLLGTNDYECRSCGAIKHDNGRVTVR